jgi:hypothetical protein
MSRPFSLILTDESGTYDTGSLRSAFNRVRTSALFPLAVRCRYGTTENWGTYHSVEDALRFIGHNWEDYQLDKEPIASRRGQVSKREASDAGILPCKSVRPGKVPTAV